VVTRILTPSAGFVPADWAAELRDEFDGDGWRVTTHRFGDQGGVDVDLVGRNLVPVAVHVEPGGGSVEVTITSESRCTRTDQS
jgi:hypothetical protein